MERLAGERVDDGVRLHVVLQLADVGLVHVGEDAHLLQVLRDDEEDGGLEAGDDRGAGIDAARDDDAVDRGVDLRVAEVGRRLIELRLLRADAGLRARDAGARGVEVGARGVVVGLGGVERALGGVEVALARQVLLEEALDAVERDARGLEVRLRRLRLRSRDLAGGARLLEPGALREELRLLRAHLRAVDGRIDLGEDVALVDEGVEVHEDARHAAVHLRADVHL